MSALLSAECEPVRRYIYGVGTALVVVAVVTGLLTDEVAVAVTGVLGAVCLVPAVEVARSKVSPVGTSGPRHRA